MCSTNLIDPLVIITLHKKSHYELQKVIFKGKQVLTLIGLGVHCVYYTSRRQFSLGSL